MRSVRFNVLVLIAFTFFFSLGYLDLSSRWWYEDDPVQYHYVTQIEEPVSIFTNPEILRGYGAGRALAPMQLLSYWTDVRLFGTPNPTAAYAHNFAALVLTVLMIELMLRRWTGNAFVSTAAASVWLILPTTIAVHYFISARHYMEGLLCGLLTMYCTEKFLTESKQARVVLWISGVLVFGGSSMLFKEIYAAMVPVYLLAIALHARRTALAGAAATLGLGYLIYRLLVYGAGINYTMPFLGVYDSLRVIVALPYTLAVNDGGYALVAGLTFVVVKLWKSSAVESEGRSATKLVLLLIAAALLATYPVAYAVLTGYKIPDTTYRMPFIVNTILVLWTGYALPQYLSRKWMTVVAIVVVFVVFPGAERTRRLWTERMARSEVEGKFYLSNPDKLMYSEEEAFWFIIGVHRLYNVAPEHYINKQFRLGAAERARIREYGEIWSYRNGSFVPNAQLLEDLQKENYP